MARKGNSNADTEGQSAGVVSDGGSEQSGEVETGSPFGEGETGAGIGGGELPPDPFASVGNSNAGYNIPKTPTGKRRGPKPGSKRGTLSAERISAARGKLTDFLAGAVGFVFSAYGGYRAKSYLKKGAPPLLANEIYLCYQCSEEETVKVGQPLADTFIEWFPPKVVEQAVKGIDPGLAIARAIVLMQKKGNNETLVIQKWQAMSQSVGQQDHHSNGAEPPQEGPMDEWMKQQSPQPEEILG